MTGDGNAHADASGPAPRDLVVYQVAATAVDMVRRGRHSLHAAMFEIVNEPHDVFEFRQTGDGVSKTICWKRERIREDELILCHAVAMAMLANAPGNVTMEATLSQARRDLEQAETSWLTNAAPPAGTDPALPPDLDQEQANSYLRGFEDAMVLTRCRWTEDAHRRARTAFPERALFDMMSTALTASDVLQGDNDDGLNAEELGLTLADQVADAYMWVEYFAAELRTTTRPSVPREWRLESLHKASSDAYVCHLTDSLGRTVSGEGGTWYEALSRAASSASAVTRLGPRI